MIAGCLEIVRVFLSKRDGNGVAEYFLKNAYQSMPFLEMLKGQSAPRGGTDNQGTLLKRHLQADSYLRAYLDERTPAKAASSGGKVKGLAGLQILDPEDRIPKLRRAQEILFGWLYGELPGAFQELVTARRKGLGARQAQRETERRLEKNPDFIASKKRIAVLEQELLLLERTRNQLPAMRNAFARSQATLLRDIDHPQDKSTHYFIKSFCVAADRADLVEQRHGHPLFEALSTISGPEIQSHQFLAYEHRGELNNGNKKYSDIHYRTIDLPFCLILVEYFKSLRPEGFKVRHARTPIAGKFERALPEYWD
jgi:hypothetical protein